VAGNARWPGLSRIPGLFDRGGFIGLRADGCTHFCTVAQASVQGSADRVFPQYTAAAFSAVCTKVRSGATPRASSCPHMAIHGGASPRVEKIRRRSRPWQNHRGRFGVSGAFAVILRPAHPVDEFELGGLRQR
jgi:hypothetical protein